MIIVTQDDTAYHFKNGNVQKRKPNKHGRWREATLVHPPRIGVPALIWYPDKEETRKTAPVVEIWA